MVGRCVCHASAGEGAVCYAESEAGAASGTISSADHDMLWQRCCRRHFECWIRSHAPQQPITYKHRWAMRRWHEVDASKCHGWLNRARRCTYRAVCHITTAKLHPCLPDIFEPDDNVLEGPLVMLLAKRSKALHAGKRCSRACSYAAQARR